MSYFYTYLHAKSNTVDTSGVFYVGKGKEDRAYDLDRPNKHHSNIVAKYGKENILVSKIDCSSEDIAFELEKGLIKCLRRMGVNLANCTNGGEGVSGYKFTEAQREKLKRSMNDPLVKSKIGMSSSVRNKGRKHSDDSLANFKAAQSRPELKLKMSEIRQAFIWIKKDGVTKRVDRSKLDMMLNGGWELGRNKCTDTHKAKTRQAMLDKRK